MRLHAPKNWMLALAAVVSTVLFFVYMAARGNATKSRAVARNRRAQLAKAPAEIQIAVVWPSLDSREMFIRGANLARDAINEAGGVNGRRIKLVFFREEKGVASRLAKDVNTVAVLGFKFSSSAMRDSVTLNNEGIIFMIPFASDWALTLKDFEYSFRIIPNALRVADWLTQFALTQAGYWSSLTNREVAVVILSPRNGFGYELERHFRKDAADWRLFSTTNSVTNTTTMRVVASKSYDPETTDFLPLVDKVLDDKFDAVLVTDTMPAAGQLIRQLRNMGVKKPILGGRGLDSSELLSIASNRAFRVYFPSKFVIPTKAAIAAMPTNLLIHSLMRRYADMYNSRPDFEAAQAYEGLHLLAEAFQRAATTSPAAVSSVLEHTGKWTGLLEVYSKFADHELVITNMFIKFAYPVGYPLTDLASYHEFVMESMTSSPFTNELEFAGYLSPAVTNKILNVDHFMHVPPHYPTGVY